jgi:hypothetical protein
MATMSKTQTSNPKEASVNQKQGPRTGNAGNAEKRSKFMAEKSNQGSEKQALANSVLAALEQRGIRAKPSIDPAVENLKPNVGPKVNPTANGSRLPRGAKSPKTRG